MSVRRTERDLDGQPARIETRERATPGERVRDRLTQRRGYIRGTYGLGRQKRYLVELDLPTGQASRRPADNVYRLPSEIERL